MSKIIIKTPATTANIGTGFDFLGMALNIYNEYLFDSDTLNTSCIGFDCKDDDNYVLKGYSYIMNKYNHGIINNIIIKQIKQDIPYARGLGSSSSALCAGILAANYYLDNMLDKGTLLKEMVYLEGHPDNIIPCYLGGLTTIINGDDIYYHQLEVSSKLGFMVIIPPYLVKTSDARSILPSSLSYKEVTNNASRVIMLPHAFKEGNIDLINLSTSDVIHEPFRKTLIKEWKAINTLLKDINVCVRISGSGPTIFIIYNKEEERFVVDRIKEYPYHLCDMDIKGTIIEEVK